MSDMHLVKLHDFIEDKLTVQYPGVAMYDADVDCYVSLLWLLDTLYKLELI